jgi:hypothetical protein
MANWRGNAGTGRDIVSWMGRREGVFGLEGSGYLDWL